jgi:hypothetical protein
MFFFEATSKSSAFSLRRKKPVYKKNWPKKYNRTPHTSLKAALQMN